QIPLCAVCSGFSKWLDRNRGLVFASFVEDHDPRRQRKQGVIFTHADVLAGVVLRTPLTDDDIPCNHFLTAEYLNAQPFAFRFAAVLYFTFTFLVCHFRSCLSLMRCRPCAGSGINRYFQFELWCIAGGGHSSPGNLFCASF